MRRLLPLALLAACLWRAPHAAAASPPYFYPFVSPYEATVMELPRWLEVSLPATVPIREFTLRVFPEREIPAVFWYEDGLVCSLAYQDRAAPLIFVVPGTGARYNSAKTLKLQKLLHQAGFHVVALSSPIHMDFVVNAGTGLPGEPWQDAEDLYRVMALAYEAVRRRVEVSSVALVGYSLGGFNAAFVARLDEERRRFNFRRVLIVNPPVDLYGAVSALDDLLVQNIPGGIDAIEPFLRSVLATVGAAAKELGYAELSGEVLYQAYKLLPRKEESLAALIGLVFRMSAGDMMFTADVMNGGGYIVPRNARLTNSTSLTRFAAVAYRTRFVDYFDEYLFPHRQAREPGLTKDGLRRRMSLRSLEAYLRTADKLRLVHNEDDIILAPGEIEYLQSVFAGRARVFPTGGHMGNTFHPDVARAIVEAVTGREP
jgi:pimeloyl-ACP methyl ester carboxylesterase